MDRLNDAIDEMAHEVSGLRDDLRKGINSNTSTIQVNAGGLGVWIATIACAVMLGISVIGAAVIVDQGRKISDLQHYLNAIYMQAPHLKQEEDD